MKFSMDWGRIARHSGSPPVPFKPRELPKWLQVAPLRTLVRSCIRYGGADQRACPGGYRHKAPMCKQRECTADFGHEPIGRGGRRNGFLQVFLAGRYSIGWRAIAAGSRPAKSQPTIAANAGMPRRMRSRSATGMFPSAASPPFSELLLSQPIIAI